MDRLFPKNGWIVYILKWLCSQSFHFVNNIFCIELLPVNVQCVYILEAQYQIVPAKAKVGVDWSMTALSIHKHITPILRPAEVNKDVIFK